MMQQVLFLVYFTTAVVAVFGAPHLNQQQHAVQLVQPPRIFGNKNSIMRLETEDDENEEMELESLKDHQNATPPTTLPASASTRSPGNVKKPENEETPAISDNANSLKFPHHNPDGFNEALFAKKNSHLANSEDFDLDKARASNFQIDYTPQDMAEYIFWTGDERGVASAIGDFLQEGMVNREDAVRFLEDVKMELVNIRSRYSASMPQKHSFNNPGNFHPSTAKRESYPTYPQYGPEFSIPESSLPLIPNNLLSMEELDYDEIAEKLRSVDAKMREFALEDVIYEIGKNLFAQALKNSKGTQESSQKFSDFIEAQSAGGKIPKDLEKDVLEVLVGAFVDAVDERGVQQAELERQLEAKRDGNKVKKDSSVKVGKELKN